MYQRVEFLHVVLTLTHGYNAVRGARTGQVPITLERKIISGGKQIKEQEVLPHTCIAVLPCGKA